jgi:hypothetical protein
MDASRHKTGPKVRKDFITTAARNAAKCVIAAEDVSRTITPVLHITCFSNAPRTFALHFTAAQATHWRSC